jgi:hypothetical protein
VPGGIDDEWGAAVAAALAPYDWRGLTQRMLARRVIGAVDRQIVVRVLAGVPGTEVGADLPVEPADAGDDRVHPLVHALDGRQWRGWSLARLCAHLLRALESWHTERDLLHPPPRRPRDGN